MIATVPEALNSMGVNTIRKFARNMWIYIGMELLESWQNTQSKSIRTHRKTPEYVIRELNNINYFLNYFYKIISH